MILLMLVSYLLLSSLGAVDGGPGVVLLLLSVLYCHPHPSFHPPPSLLLHCPPSVVVDPMYLELERWLSHLCHFDTRYVGHFAIWMD